LEPQVRGVVVCDVDAREADDAVGLGDAVDRLVEGDLVVEATACDEGAGLVDVEPVAAIGGGSPRLTDLGSDLPVVLDQRGVLVSGGAWC